MSAKYRITVKQDPNSGYWTAMVRYEGDVVSPSWPGQPSRDDAKALAEQWATSHARSQASREDYDFTPTV